jgi:ABC-2 type transport system permease protein
MRVIGFILQKEFIQLFRNRMMVRIIFLMPVVQLFILAYAATFEIRDIRLTVVDQDNSVLSRELIRHFEGSPFYTIAGRTGAYENAGQKLTKGTTDQVIIIPADLEKDLVNHEKASVQLVTNAIDGTAASLMNAYSLGIIRNFNKNLLVKNSADELQPPLDITYSYWYNPELDYLIYMVPGILVILVTVIGMLLSGMSLVREKEIGTIEQINVTPIRKIQFIIGKFLPYWVVALADLALGLAIAKAAFDIPMEGSLLVIFLAASIYLLVVQGFGLMISTVTNTQQQSLFLTWFFLVIFILMGGLFTPVDSMPQWAKDINLVNPIAYFIEAMRMVLLKGSGLGAIWKSILTLGIFGVVVFSFATWRYRKVS